MPVDQTLDREARVLRLVLTGTVSVAETTAAVNLALATIGGETGFYVLSDHRRLLTAATSAQLEALVEHLRRDGLALHGQKFAVVTSMAVSYGMMRMFSVLAERIPMDVMVFHDMAEAERWLGL